LTIELPGPTSAGTGSPPQAQLVAYTPVNVRGNVSATGNTITWLPAGGAADWLPGIALNSPPGDRGILARLTLKGNFIWTPTTPPLFLDGEVFGFAQNGVSALNLPSGDRRRGGNFDMWFWLIAQPARLASLSVSQLSIFQGDTTTVTVTLNNPATSGLVATLASSVPAVAAVPASITFTTGATSASFPITGAAQGSTTITATLGTDTRTVTLTVAQRPTTLVALLISPSLVAAGTATTGTISLSQPAPQSMVISLSSSNTNVASVPAAVSATPGATSVGFTINTGAAGTATITATFGNSVQAPVTAVKTKDKEKEKDKEKDKEITKEISKEKEREKVTLEKLITIEQTPLRPLPRATAMVNGTGDSGAQFANARAFIRSDERPEIPLPG
jgi:hypothetical protein